jgi:O-methyltransferase domain/Dimerisation domain
METLQSLGSAMEDGSARQIGDTTTSSMTLLHMAAGGWVAQAVYVAAKLGIADLLESGPKSSAELAEKTSSHPESLYRLMRMLASLGVFAEDTKGLFALSTLADGLRTNAAISLRAFAIMLGEPMLWRPWGELLHSIRTGEAAFAHVFGGGLYDYLGQNPDAAVIFDAAITDRARQENAALIAAYDWWPDTIIDVGGGQGSLLAAILGHAQNARGVLFEAPHVTETAAILIEQAGLTDRCGVVSGDFFEGLPANGNLYLMRRIVHGWSDDRARAILRNCRVAVREDGRLLVVEHVLAAGNAPSWGKLLDVQQLILSAGGRERTEAEYADLLNSAGFRLERIIPTTSTASLIEAMPV